MRESFIVHVYRRDGLGRITAGTVEGIHRGVKKAFGSAEELWAYLNAQRGAVRRRGSPGGGSREPDGSSDD